MPTWLDIDAFSVSMVLCIEKLHLETASLCVVYSHCRLLCVFCAMPTWLDIDAFSGTVHRKVAPW